MTVRIQRLAFMPVPTILVCAMLTACGGGGADASVQLGAALATNSAGSAEQVSLAAAASLPSSDPYDAQAGTYQSSWADILAVQEPDVLAQATSGQALSSVEWSGAMAGSMGSAATAGSSAETDSAIQANGAVANGADPVLAPDADGQPDKTASAVTAPPTAVGIAVGATARQTFVAFGTSQPRDDSIKFMKLDTARRDAMLDLVYRDLGVNALRLWINADPDSSLEAMKASFYAGYVDSGLLQAIQQRGAKQLLLAPARGEVPPTESMAMYAAKLAQFIADIKRERGIVINVTGMANEPAGFTPQQLTDLARALRARLNMLGLSSVGIISPEWASPDGYLGRVIDSMRADTLAWAGIRGIGAHSYNMGLNPTIAAKFAGSAKEYWQTEAGKQTLKRGVDEQPGNAAEASTVAARFLNDMNQGATHWFWFIGAHNFDPHPFGDGGQELVRPNNATGGLKISTKYYYLKQLLKTFDRGAVFRAASSSIGGGMVWGYGLKPAITLAAAKNPDGTWAIGASNTSGIAATKISSYAARSTYQLMIQLPEPVNANFQVLRSGATKSIVAASDVKAVNGLLTTLLAPNELVTLRQIK